jgi:hypothetical protein
MKRQIFGALASLVLAGNMLASGLDKPTVPVDLPKGYLEEQGFASVYSDINATHSLPLTNGMRFTYIDTIGDDDVMIIDTDRNVTLKDFVEVGLMTEAFLEEGLKKEKETNERLKNYKIRLVPRIPPLQTGKQARETLATVLEYVSQSKK